MVGFVMATHGGTSAVFVFIFSRLARHTGRFALFVLAAAISLALLIGLLDWTPGSDQQTLIFIFPVLWGIGEGIWQTQTNCELVPAREHCERGLRRLRRMSKQREQIALGRRHTCNKGHSKQKELIALDRRGTQQTKGINSTRQTRDTANKRN